MGDCNLDILENNNIKITNKHLILIIMNKFKFKLPLKKSKNKPNISWTISWQLCSQKVIIKFNNAKINFFSNLQWPKLDHFLNVRFIYMVQVGTPPPHPPLPKRFKKFIFIFNLWPNLAKISTLVTPQN
jgi:hypothetical protein